MEKRKDRSNTLKTHEVYVVLRIEVHVDPMADSDWKVRERNDVGKGDIIILSIIKFRCQPI